MMAMRASMTGTGFQVAPQGGSCCGTSSDKPIPAGAVQPASDRLALTSPLATAGDIASVLPVPEVESRDGVPPDMSSPPQAVLCTFLI